MSHPTPLHPTTTAPAPSIDTAIAEVRAAFAAAEATPLPRAVRFDLETALGLAENAPQLYEMGAGTRGRFTLIATFIHDALTVLDEQAKR